MFYKLLKSLLFIAISFIVGCGKNNIEIVQQASPSSYPNITYKQLLENHNEFSSYTWEEIKTERGEKAIQFTAKYKEDFTQKLYKTRIFIAQFDLNSSGEGFTLGYFGNSLEVIDKNFIEQFNIKESIVSSLNPEDVLGAIYNQKSILTLTDAGPNDGSMRIWFQRRLLKFASELDSTNFMRLLEIRGHDVDTNTDDVYIVSELDESDALRYLWAEDSTEKGILLITLIEKLIDIYPNIKSSDLLRMNESGSILTGWYDTHYINDELIPVATALLNKIKK